MRDVEIFRGAGEYGVAQGLPQVRGRDARSRQPVWSQTVARARAFRFRTRGLPCGWSSRP